MALSFIRSIVKDKVTGRYNIYWTDSRGKKHATMYLYYNGNYEKRGKSMSLPTFLIDDLKDWIQVKKNYTIKEKRSVCTKRIKRDAYVNASYQGYRSD